MPANQARSVPQARVNHPASSRLWPQRTQWPPRIGCASPLSGRFSTYRPVRIRPTPSPGAGRRHDGREPLRLRTRHQASIGRRYAGLSIHTSTSRDGVSKPAAISASAIIQTSLAKSSLFSGSGPGRPSMAFASSPPDSRPPPQIRRRVPPPVTQARPCATSHPLA